MDGHSPGDPELEDHDLQEEVRALKILNDTGVVIASQLELDAIVQAVVDAGVSITGAQFGAFFYNVLDDSGEAYLLYALSGAPQEAFSSYPHPRATPVFAPTFKGEGVVRSDDITQDPRYGAMGPHYGMPAGHLPVRSYLAVPVASRSGEVLGGLFFGHEEPGRFKARQERLMLGIAAQAAVAIDNARLFHALQTELKRREAVEATLRETDMRLNAVLDNATVAIFLMNDRQHCVYMNAAAEKLTGFSLAETQGRPLHDVIHHTRPDGSPFPLEECAIDRAFPENNQTQGEEVFVHRDGRFYPVAFTASPIRDAAARTIGTIVEVRDVSDEKRHEATRNLLIREVDHRARNALAVVQSILSLTKAETVEEYRNTVVGRVRALAAAQTRLTDQGWRGASLTELVHDALTALAREDSFQLKGPQIMVAPDQAQPISMIIHEWATNARKYGALSREGLVSVTWTATPVEIELVWSEAGGPSVTTPTRTGFGSRLITQLAEQLGATVTPEWRPDGLRVRLRIPRA
jgi:PAS domain S-box-containing protein